MNKGQKSEVRVRRTRKKIRKAEARKVRIFDLGLQELLIEE